MNGRLVGLLTSSLSLYTVTRSTVPFVRQKNLKEVIIIQKLRVRQYFCASLVT